MRININNYRPKVGDKVAFRGYTIEQVRWGGNDTPDMLDTNTTYAITYVEVHASHTKVTLDGYPDLKFNSVHFALA